VVALTIAVMGVGYTLVYAAVANGGRFAEQPWRAFFEDAYGGASPAASYAGFLGETLHVGKSIVQKILGFITSPFGGLPFLP